VVGKGMDLSKLKIDPAVMENFSKVMNQMQAKVPEEEMEKMRQEILEGIKETTYDEDVESDMEEFLSSKDEIRKTSESIFSKKK
jgi:hypothetical protein